jgi:hypothetical protein
MAENTIFEVRDDLKAWLMSKDFREVKGKQGLYAKAVEEEVAFIDFRADKKNPEGCPKGRRYAKGGDGAFIKNPQEYPEILLEYKLFRDDLWARLQLDGPVKMVSHEENVAKPVQEIPKEHVQTMGEKLQEAMQSRAPPAKESAPAKSSAPAVIPAGKNTPLIRNKFTVSTFQEYPKEFLVQLQGNMYITKAGLLWKAKNMGLRDIRVKNLHWSFDKRQGGEFPEGVAVCEATVTMQDGSVYVDTGVAYDGNVKLAEVKKNLDHMASTRAVNRALRLATACGFCSLEETDVAGEDDDRNVINVTAQVVQ